MLGYKKELGAQKDLCQNEFLAWKHLLRFINFCIAKLSFNFNLKFNLVESWEGFIFDFSNHSTPPHPPTHPPEKVRKKQESSDYSLTYLQINLT